MEAFFKNSHSLFSFRREMSPNQKNLRISFLGKFLSKPYQAHISLDKESIVVTGVSSVAVTWLRSSSHLLSL